MPSCAVATKSNHNSPPLSCGDLRRAALAPRPHGIGQDKGKGLPPLRPLPPPAAPPPAADDDCLPPLVPLPPPYTLPAERALDPRWRALGDGYAHADRPPDSASELNGAVEDEYYDDEFRPRNRYERCILDEVPSAMHGHIVLVAHQPRVVLNFVAPLRTGCAQTPEEGLRPIVALVPSIPDSTTLRVLHRY
eukprot:gene1383-6909_t